MNRITITLERIAGGAALALMLALFALTLGAPMPATASPPVLIVATPLIGAGAGPIRAAVEQEPPAAQVPTPALPTPAPTEAPTAIPTAAIVVAQSPPAAPAVAESQIIVEADGHLRLPGSEDWMANLPPTPEPTAIPPADGPPPPRGGCGPRCGWRPAP